MSTSPISAFALHIWDDLNVKPKALPDYVEQDPIALERFAADMWADQSRVFINQLTHRGSFAAKMELLARLPGM